MSMHAFVTGGTGFLGANLIDELLAGGWRVTAMHRAGSDTRFLERAGVDRVVADLADPESLRAALPDTVDAVFHMAANTCMWRGGDARQWQDNVVGSANLASAVRAHFALRQTPGRMIVTSSISAYGYHHQPISESSAQIADDPKYHYHYSKKQMELAVRKEIEQGLDAVFMNPCGIVGKYDRSNWAQTFFMIAEDRLPGVPPGSGSFCHAGAVARAHIQAFHRGRCGENYILAGTDATFLEFFATVARLLGKPEPSNTTPAVFIRTMAAIQDAVGRISGREPAITPQKAAMITRRVTASCARAEAELGYNGAVSLEDILRECRDWLVAERLIKQ